MHFCILSSKMWNTVGRNESLLPYIFIYVPKIGTQGVGESRHAYIISGVPNRHPLNFSCGVKLACHILKKLLIIKPVANESEMYRYVG